MKQLTQSLRNGDLHVTEIPAPLLQPGGILVQTAYSLVSAGTERAKVQVAQMSLLGKARARPDQAKQVLDAVRAQGLAATYRKVINRLDALEPLGYSCAGKVLEVGADAREFQVGERVACAGGGYANHAEVNFIPRNLAIHVPEQVGLDAAAFATVGAIALQGVRQAETQLGDVVVVIGLGLVGLLTTQLLKAAGCVVVGFDVNAERCRRAESLGCAFTANEKQILQERVLELTLGNGADAVLITAATKSNEPVELAGAVAREKARVVIVGDVGLQIPRPPYYNKELDLRLSRSYGPGRYDPSYEEGGNDYPYGYVRWTERRNMQAFLQLVAQGSVQVTPLITHRFKIDDAERAYALIEGKLGEPYLGVVLEYPIPDDRPPTTAPTRILVTHSTPVTRHPSSVILGMIGAGNFAQDTLLPALRAIPEVKLRTVVTASGLSARGVAERFGFAECASDARMILDDPEINAVLIATRHDSHATLAADALRAGKAVFVEKPLALNEEQLELVLSAYAEATTSLLMVGFNRRFAPFSIPVQKLFRLRAQPLMLHYRANVGMIPRAHWTQNPQQGGGRILGEACHFVDWIQALIGAPPVNVFARALPNGGMYNDDNVSITIAYAEGSVGTILYAANGDKRMGKERIEVFGSGRMAILDDWRTLTLGDGAKTTTQQSRMSQDKGHAAELRAFVNAIKNPNPAPIPLAELVDTTRVTFAILESLRSSAPINLTTFNESNG